MTETLDPPAVDLDELRASIRAEYAAVAAEPDRGFHFHTGYGLAAIPPSIWYGKSWGTTARTVADALVYGFVTGGTFGWLWPAA